MGRRKGQGMQIDLIVRYLLVLFAFFGIMILILNSSGALSGIIANFCQANPQLCGGTDMGSNRNFLATDSMITLSCALKAVIAGDADHRCIGTLRPSASVAGETASGSSAEPRISVQQAENEITVPEQAIGGKDISLSCSYAGGEFVYDVRESTIFSTTSGNALAFCQEQCTGNDCSARVEPDGIEILAALQPYGKALECRCMASGTEVTGRGFSVGQALSECRQSAQPSDITLQSCAHVDVKGIEYQFLLDRFDVDAGDVIRGRAFTAPCTFRTAEGQLIEYPVYGDFEYLDELCQNEALAIGGTDASVAIDLATGLDNYRSDGQFVFFYDGFVDATEFQTFRCINEFTKPSVACTVENFQLFQDVSNAEDWIKGYGDPAFLVYFQAFPLGEDAAWNSKGVWAENLVDLAFVWWGAGKVFNIAGKSIYAKFGGLSTKEILKGIVHTETAALDKPATEIAKRVSSDLLKTWAVRNPGKVIGVVAATVIAAQMDSIVGKYDEKAGSLVLKSPYIPPTVEPIGTTVEPVFLVKDRDILYDDAVPLYLASPCDANLEVSHQTAECIEYSYDLDRNAVACVGDPQSSPPSGIELENKENLARKNPWNMCRSSTSAKDYFPPENSFILNEIDNLMSGELDEVTLTTEVGDGFILHEPLTGFDFEFKNREAYRLFGSSDLTGKVLDTFSFPDASGKRVMLDIEVPAGDIRYSGTEALIADPSAVADPNDQKATASNEHIKVEFSQFICICDSDRCNEEITCNIRGDVEIINEADCEYCHYVEDKLDKASLIRFDRNRLEVTAEDTSSRANVFTDNLRLVYTEPASEYPRFAVLFGDTPQPPESIFPEGSTLADVTGALAKDGKIDYIGIENDATDRESIDAFSTFDFGSRTEGIFTDLPDQVIFQDANFDHKIDLIQQNKCFVQGPTVKVTQRNDIEGPNFCFAEESAVRTGLRWAPEIGAAIGGTVGLLGGPTAGITIPGGATVGYKAGAVVFTGYVLTEKFIISSRSIWPGRG